MCCNRCVLTEGTALDVIHVNWCVCGLANVPLIATARTNYNRTDLTFKFSSR